MRLNGINAPIMAASEPPEPPPPRNPDRINASLKKNPSVTTSLDQSKSTKSQDTELEPLAQSNGATAIENLKEITPIPAVEQKNQNGLNEIKTKTNSTPSSSSSASSISKQESKVAATQNKINTDKLDYFQNQQNHKQFLEEENEEIKMLLQKSELDDEFDDLDSPQSSKLKLENQRLAAEISRLKRLLEISPDEGGAVGGTLSDTNSETNQFHEETVESLRNELKLAREQISQLKLDRKKMRSEKNDLLAHVRQLCSSLQDKEQELRDFIRNYEARIRDSESSAKNVTGERDRERWTLIKQAKEEAERSMALAAKLQRTQEALLDAKRQLAGCVSDQESMPPLTSPTAGQGIPYMNAANNGISLVDRGSYSADSGIRGSSDHSAAGEMTYTDENGICVPMDPDSISILSGQQFYQFGVPKERSPTVSPLNTGAFHSRSVDNGNNISCRSIDQIGTSVNDCGESNFLMRKLNKHSNTLGRSSSRGTWGSSISKVFGRSKNRSRNGSSQQSDTESVPEFTWSPLNEEGYAEKLRLLREASTMPMEKWRASQVLAWLEVALGMPQYSSRCCENVKSGKILLELNDAELEAGLGLANPMHRKKIRLAIEEHRRPDLVRYSSIGALGHTWVASEWLPDIGLPQYIESFLHSFVDARMLDTLSKKELEKMLGVTRKFHQASIVHGIHVLRIIKYDRQELAVRRMQSENVDTDPIVWTNQRFIRWVRSIDLAEYAENLKDSGVHGGLVVLEPSFTGETMATALGIDPSKNIIRRHLVAEFDALVLPARSLLGQGIRSGGGQVIPLRGGLHTLNHQYSGTYHYATTDRKATNLRFGGWRGSQNSLSKVFGLKSRPEKGSSTSPTPSFSSSEGYATIGSFFQPPPPPPSHILNNHSNNSNSHRVSAPPIESSALCTLPRSKEQHRRVKSIGDIETAAANAAKNVVGPMQQQQDCKSKLTAMSKNS